MAFALPVRTGQASPRDTARRAVQVLRDEGLVVTVPQRGAYVVDR